MEPQARQIVLDQLATSETTLLRLFDGISEAQWHFRESRDRWSIAENLEHLIALEAFLRTMIERVLDAPAQPDKKSAALTKDPQILGLPTSRDMKLKAREVAQPQGRWSTPEAMIAEFRATRAHTIAFAAHTEAPLHDHFFPHIAFGDLDCYQWLVVLAQHTLRHVAQIDQIDQIDQIKADPAYPTS